MTQTTTAPATTECDYCGEPATRTAEQNPYANDATCNDCWPDVEWVNEHTPAECLDRPATHRDTWCYRDHDLEITLGY